MRDRIAVVDPRVREKPTVLHANADADRAPANPRDEQAPQGDCMDEAGGRTVRVRRRARRQG
jgi:hypothetical protein